MKNFMNILEGYVWLVMCVYFEARGEPEMGQVAVAHVVLNRAEQRNLDIKGVILQPHQFSWVEHATQTVLSNQDFISGVFTSAKAVYKCSAQRVMGLNLMNANHFYNSAEVSPSWAEGMKEITKIGDVVFKRDY